MNLKENKKIKNFINFIYSREFRFALILGFYSTLLLKSTFSVDKNDSKDRKKLSTIKKLYYYFKEYKNKLTYENFFTSTFGLIVGLIIGCFFTYQLDKYRLRNMSKKLSKALIDAASYFSKSNFAFDHTVQVVQKLAHQDRLMRMLGEEYLNSQRSLDETYKLLEDSQRNFEDSQKILDNSQRNLNECYNNLDDCYTKLSDSNKVVQILKNAFFNKKNNDDDDDNNSSGGMISA